jgi:ABC-type branched-subunit amino acid transport system substrate-binding protein
MVRAVRARAPRVLVAGIGPGFAGAGFISAAGSAAAGVVRAETWSTEFAERNDVARRLAVRYTQRYHTPMTADAANGFTAVLTAAVAIDTTAATTPAAVRSALVGADLPGTSLPMPWSGVRFARGGQNAGARGVIEQVREGRARTVYPLELADTEIQL